VFEVEAGGKCSLPFTPDLPAPNTDKYPGETPAKDRSLSMFLIKKRGGATGGRAALIQRGGERVSVERG
jgi:hypothetical protein